MDDLRNSEVFSTFEVMSRRRQLSPRKLQVFWLGTEHWAWLLTVTWAGQGFPQVTPSNVIMSHWSQSIHLLIDAPWETLHSLFADVTHLLSEPTSSYCLDGKFLSVILLVLSVQGTPTYPPPRFCHWHFAESASSQTFPSLLSIHSFYFLVYFKVSCRHQHTALSKHFNNLCLDFFF